MSSAGPPISTDHGLIVPVRTRFYDGSAELTIFVTEDGMEIEQIMAPLGVLENATEQVTGAFFNGRLVLLARGHCALNCDPEPPLFQLVWTP